MHAAISLLLALGLAHSSVPAAHNSLQADIATIVDLFYNNDFDQASHAVENLESRHPKHPAGPLFLAIVKYQRWVSAGLNEDGSWQIIESELKRALDLAKDMESVSPAQAHYYSGAALGFRARGLATRHRFVSAITDASASVRQLKEALALDPQLTDARLGLGMYHYFAARMPLPTKPMARLLVGEYGNREKGLEELWAVAQSSGIARMEARSVLSMILTKNDEADWNGADLLLTELMARYPRNPIYRLRLVYVAQRKGQLDRALTLADPNGAWLNTLHPSMRKNALAWAHYRTAECRLFQSHYDLAAQSLSKIEIDTVPKSLVQWIALRFANIEDAQGRHESARVAYSKISDKNATPLARRFRSQPFPEGPRDIAPFYSGY
jgi:outer membrane protein assembly factor BamD (BamD/ComL family)